MTWHARLQRVDPGWLDVGFAVALLDTTRARRELDWSPTVPADVALAQVLRGMADSAAAPNPVLRPRSIARELTALVGRGPIGRRRLP